MKPTDRLILASRSPRRRDILRFAGIPHRVILPKGVSEQGKPVESPSRFVKRLAYEKALSVARRYPGYWVLGADTIVVCGGRMIGKPHNRVEARQMLQKLQGRAHTVWTGVALVGKGGREVSRYAESTRVVFRKISASELNRYLKTREPYDKAGAYAIQGTAGAWVQTWKGDYFNVMGLPLRWVVQATRGIFSPPKRS